MASSQTVVWTTDSPNVVRKLINHEFLSKETLGLLADELSVKLTGKPCSCWSLYASMVGHVQPRIAIAMHCSRDGRHYSKGLASLEPAESVGGWWMFVQKYDDPFPPDHPSRSLINRLLEFLRRLYPQPDALVSDNVTAHAHKERPDSGIVTEPGVPRDPTAWKRWQQTYTYLTSSKEAKKKHTLKEKVAWLKTNHPELAEYAASTKTVGKIIRAGRAQLLERPLHTD